MAIHSSTLVWKIPWTEEPDRLQSITYSNILPILKYVVLLDFKRFLYILFFKFYFIFKLYNIVLVLPNIEMNPPQVYPRSPF